MNTVNTELFSNQLENMLPIIQQINEQFKDPVMLKPNLTILNRTIILFFCVHHRIVRHLFASALQNSFLYMKQNA